MRFDKNIFLIGPMGAGKTTIGRHLARELHRPFFDSDRVIEERTGANIPLIFDLEGEEGFRKREQAVLDELTAMDQIVLATGGGAVLREANREYLRNRGVVFYLSSDLASLLERTRKDKNRPLLNAAEPPGQVLQRLLEERDPLYRQTAHHVIDTANSSIRLVIKAIIRQLKTMRNTSDAKA